MPVFEYVAIDALGKNCKGILAADSAASARHALLQRKLFVKSLRAAQAGAVVEKTPTRSGWQMPVLFSGVTRQQLTGATQVLATLLEAGLPLDKALSGLIENMPTAPAQRVFSHILERVKEGWELSAALAEHPRVFPDTYIHMVRAGESSGTLQIVMSNLSTYLERQYALKRKLQAAMMYPCFILVFGALVISILLLYVIPEVTRIFIDLKRDLPTPTVILIAVTDFMRSYWPLMLGGVVGLFLTMLRVARIPAVRRVLDRIILYLPVIGPIVHDAAMARLTRSLGTCLKQGVTLLDAVDIGAAVAGNTVFAEAMASVREKAQQGAGITEPMRATGVFSPIVLQLAAAGEQSGQLDSMLLTVARMLEADVENRVTAASSVVEPALILAMGAVVAFMVVAVMLPIFEMSSLIG